MTRTALSPARPRRAYWQGGLSAALAVVLALGAASPVAAEEPGAAPQIEYRFPFDPDTTTPKGGEFASKIANGKKRKHPHRGHDFSFGGARGADIPAIAAGIVRAKSTKGSLGNCVALEHADGAFSAYCHMEKPTPLELGQHVAMGETVGKVGGSGKPKVPVHLHMTMGWSVDAMTGVGTFDPIPYIQARLAQPKPEPKPEKAEKAEKAPERPAPAEGIAVTHSFAAAV